MLTTKAANPLKISIIVPCHNEQAGIPLLLESMDLVLGNLPDYRFQVILVDDGSLDQTSEVIAGMSMRHGEIQLVQLTRNFGKEVAMTAGLDHAEGDAVIFMDADLQHPPEVIPRFLSAWSRGSMMVVGRRKTRQTDTRSYRFLAGCFYSLHNLMSDVKLPANVGDFRLLDREVAENLKLLRERQRFMKGLFAWIGYEPCYIDYEVAPRIEGESKYNKWRAWNFAIESITSFSTIPLRIWTYLGVLMLALGLLYAAVIIAKGLMYGVDVPGYITSLTTLILFGGVQLIGIGVLGEYVGRIYVEVKQRPLYLQRKGMEVVAEHPKTKESPQMDPTPKPSD